MFKIILLIVFISVNKVFAGGKCNCVKKNVDVADVIKSGDKCTIFNRKYAEFIYPIDGMNLDSERRNIASWIPGWKDEQCYWKLEKYSTNNAYKIKSLTFDEYFYSLDTKEHTDTRPALTWKPKTTCESQCYWDLSLVDEKNNKYFLIRNTEFDEYLFASADTFDSDRRMVYTRKNIAWFDVHNDEAAHWAIHCE